MRVCRLRYPTCNEHAPHCHLCPARLYNIFPHSHKRQEIRGKKKVTENKIVCRSSLIFPETFLILRRTKRDTMKNVYRSSFKVRFILTRFELNLNFLYRFSKNIQMSNFIKIRPMGTELFHADKHTRRS